MSFAMKSFSFMSFILMFLVAFVNGENDTEQNSTHLASINAVLLVATLDGTLVAVNRRTGHVYWTIKDDPVIQIPPDLVDRRTFLPDPKDGSLYAIVSGEGGLKKMPFTIPELVSASPCKSTDGFLYTGKKVDTWYVIDPLSGSKRNVLSTVDSDTMCPEIPKNPHGLYVGKSAFSVTMHDAKTGMKMWNVTYSCAIPQGKSPVDYDLAHFTASSSGLVVTVDRSTGSLLWFHDYQSPIVAINTLGTEGLFSVPFTSVASETLSYFTNHLSYGFMDKLALYPRLFVGKSENGFYALPSLVDERTIDVLNGPKLLGGPESLTTDTTSIPSSNPRNKENIPLISIGYYDVPDLSQATILQSREAIAHKLPLPSGASGSDGTIKKMLNTTPNTTFRHILQRHSNNIDGVNVFVLAFVGLLLTPMIFVVVKRRLAKVSSKSDVPTDTTIVGKISFKTKDLLGKGCDGTFVFRGKFDGRDVAVKRILPECFDLGNREVELLREADSHPHVVRYFCMEVDRQFQYIALELCEATLCDYIENSSFDRTDLDPISVLRQATLGLQHLHSLDIVHRDLKPQNVLISLKSFGSHCVRVMISDFGLCKKLATGRSSFSKISGYAGTDGWMAPEALLETGRTTRAVDIFSLGCIFYYILSNGNHPFGDTLHRQLNIQAGHHQLNRWCNSLSNDLVALVPPIVEKMIASDFTIRPQCSTILKHPIFWSAEYKMEFFQDVSDRVEKETFGSHVLSNLEKGNIYVVKRDWRDHIGPELQTDLRKFRSYRGRSVRDLLRAIRNKKHHYRELPDDVRLALGESPKEFLTYFTSRFPQLLIHVYHAMQCCKDEPAFGKYYSKEYEFQPCCTSECTSWREAKTLTLETFTDDPPVPKTSQKSGAEQ